MAVQIQDGEIILSGMVGDDYWGDGFTSGQVIAALAQLGRGTDVTIRLNSGGGIATEGAAIHAALSSHKGRVTILVEGIAASAASLIACAGDVVEMALGSVFMIHDPATITWGTSSDHELAIRMLESLATSYAATYAEKTGGEPDAMRALMRAETWLTAQEAVDQGFADQLATANDNAAPADPTAFAYSMYAKAPARIVALASANGWKPPQSIKPAAASASGPASAPAAASPATPVASTPPAAPAAQPDTQEPPLADTNEDTIRTDERTKATAAANTRIQAILSSDDARGRETMAQHLAFATAHSAEDAIALLKTAPTGGDAADDRDPTASFLERKEGQGDGLGGPAPKMTDKAQAKAGWTKAVANVNKRIPGAR